MAYVCETLQVIEGVQTCASWVVQSNFTDYLAITGEEARLIYREFGKLWIVFVSFAVIAKSAKLL